MSYVNVLLMYILLICKKILSDYFDMTEELTTPSPSTLKYKKGPRNVTTVSACDKMGDLFLFQNLPEGGYYYNDSSFCTR